MITPTLNVKLIYPETRWVKASEIMAWASDALANNETAKQAETLEEAIAILEDLGHITVDRSRR
jgi:hypothetical protein